MLPLQPTPPKYDKRLPPPLLPEQSSSLRRVSVLPISPGISPAVDYMLQQQEQALSAVTKSPNSQPQSATETEKVKLPSIPNNIETKESWRKSDSTNSHTTVRPGGNGGSTRTSRPVSWAESFQSTHTVVQVSNKRLSVLITDGMPEEDDESFVSCGDVSGSHPSRTVKHRHSLSLNLAPSTNSKAIPSSSASASMTELKHSISSVVSPSTMINASPAQSSAPAQTLILADATDADRHPLANNFRGKLAAWANPNSSSDNLSRQDRTLPAIPLQQRRPSLPHFADGGGVTSPSTFTPTPTPTPTSFRQTTISMTASGLAAGLAKRAVEKMGRKWGISLSPSTSGSGSGYSSSSSSTNAPSSLSSASHPDYGLVRTNSNQSTPSVHSQVVRSSHSHGSAVGLAGGGGKRRTPDAPSGAYSPHPVTPKSDVGPFAFSGPTLGTMLRGQLRDVNGMVTNSVVFGRDLRVVTKETGINVGKGIGFAGVSGGKVKEGLVFELEGRLLPAIVVRCAQHLLIWGVQEEGLFRWVLVF